MTQNVIPRIHHMVWCTPNELLPKLQPYRISWMRHNPSWDFLFWKMSEMPFDKIPQICADVIRDEKVYWVMKSDVARWLVLYLYGGVYSDTDVECMKPMDRFLSDGCFCGRSYHPTGVGNAIVGSVAGNPLMLDIAIATAEAISKDLAFANSNIVDPTVNLAGKMLEKCPNIYPVEYFYPYSWGQKKEGRSQASSMYDQAYTVHHWSGTDPDGWCAETIHKHERQVVLPKGCVEKKRVPQIFHGRNYNPDRVKVSIGEIPIVGQCDNITITGKDVLEGSK